MRLELAAGVPRRVGGARPELVVNAGREQDDGATRGECFRQVRSVIGEGKKKIRTNSSFYVTSGSGG